MKLILALVASTLILSAPGATCEDFISRWLNTHTPTNHPCNSTRWTAQDWDLLAFQRWQEHTSASKLGGSVPVDSETAAGAMRYLERAKQNWRTE